MEDLFSSDELPDQVQESARIDFKSQLDVNSAADWLEIIKDIVAFANSGGGTILIGLLDNGEPSDADVEEILRLDHADIVNRIYKYTNIHFDGFVVRATQRHGRSIAAIVIDGSRIPIIFTKVGTYEPIPGKQKTVFSVGTVYFRHGAKSEPGTQDDLRSAIERELDLVKRSWLDGITKVVEAPAGSKLVVVAEEKTPQSAEELGKISLTVDPTAPAFYALPIDQTHPHRQKEVIREFNQRMEGKHGISGHDLQCVRAAYDVKENKNFCYVQNYASPRYSEAFVLWLCAEYEKNSNFFADARVKYDSELRKK